jgi:hypothetical protein
MRKRKLLGWGLVFVLAAMFVVAGMPQAYAAGKSATKVIEGKIITAAYGAWRPWGRNAELVVEVASGKQYTVRTGFKTNYVPHRSPIVGDRVTINCVMQQGVWAAVTIRYHQ